jgi:hypothetical protein
MTSGRPDTSFPILSASTAVILGIDTIQTATGCGDSSLVSHCRQSYGVVLGGVNRAC